MSGFDGLIQILLVLHASRFLFSCFLVSSRNHQGTSVNVFLVAFSVIKVNRIQ